MISGKPDLFIHMYIIFISVLPRISQRESETIVFLYFSGSVLRALSRILSCQFNTDRNSQHAFNTLVHRNKCLVVRSMMAFDINLDLYNKGKFHRLPNNNYNQRRNSIIKSGLMYIY